MNLAKKKKTLFKFCKIYTYCYFTIEQKPCSLAKSEKLRLLIFNLFEIINILF